MQVCNKQSLGYWQIKTDLLKKYKDDKRQKQNRFQKKNRFNDQPQQLDSSGSSMTGNGMSKTLLSGKTTSDSLSLEINSSVELPPLWVEIHHETDQILKELTEIKNEVAKLSGHRIRKQFNDNSDLDSQINSLTAIASKKLREAEVNLKRMDKVAATTKETENEQKIRLNVKMSLAQQIQEMTVDLRRQQKGLFDSLKKYNNLGTTGFMHAVDNNSQQQQNGGDGQYSAYMAEDVDMYQQVAQERDSEINKIVDMINELSSIYQQLGHLVLEQGTLIDRIDFNITETKKNVQQSNIHLKSAAESQESPTARKCILILIALILFFSFVLTLRYYG